MGFETDLVGDFYRVLDVFDHHFAGLEWRFAKLLFEELKYKFLYLLANYFLQTMD